MILHADSVAIWDIKDCELINELRTPKDIQVKVMDIDWAASDRAVLATDDGCLRVTGLAMNGSTSAMFDYTSEDPISCHSLLPNKARNNFHTLLKHQPWRSGYSLHDLSATEDGFSKVDLEMIKDQVRLLPENAIEFLRDSGKHTIEDRCLLASQLTGSLWEADFWKVFKASLNSTTTLISASSVYKENIAYDLACDSLAYLSFHEERMKLYESRASTREQRRKIIDIMICLGRHNDAVRLLLETDPDDPSYYEDNLKACLISSKFSSSRGEDDNNNDDARHSTTKLVATNLIAEGKLWEGVQLLCLIDKVADACSYLQSYGHWDASLWLAKCRLDNRTRNNGDRCQEFDKIVQKYCDTCVTRGMKKKALLVQMSNADYVAVLDTLVKARMIDLAARFLEVLLEKKLLPDTSHVFVITEEIYLAYARHLFDLGNKKGSFFYCDKADEKGEILKRELQVLSSPPPQDNEKLISKSESENEE